MSAEAVILCIYTHIKLVSCPEHVCSPSSVCGIDACLAMLGVFFFFNTDCLTVLMASNMFHSCDKVHFRSILYLFSIVQVTVHLIFNDSQTLLNKTQVCVPRVLLPYQGVFGS